MSFTTIFPRLRGAACRGAMQRVFAALTQALRSFAHSAGVQVHGVIALSNMLLAVTQGQG
jgi:hypothetical protein